MPGKPTTQIKTSFPPISNTETRILILGSLPGERSLQMAEYYAHPRNRFWRLIAFLTDSPVPAGYDEKNDLLLANGIGLWDVVREAERPGSLDVNIVGEIPNLLDEFVDNHPNLKVIAFNGQKAEKLFDRYFERRHSMRYVSLPSTSPANAGITFEALRERWKLFFFQANKR